MWQRGYRCWMSIKGICAMAKFKNQLDKYTVQKIRETKT